MPGETSCDTPCTPTCRRRRQARSTSPHRERASRQSVWQDDRWDFGAYRSAGDDSCLFYAAWACPASSLVNPMCRFPGTRWMDRHPAPRWGRLVVRQEAQQPWTRLSGCESHLSREGPPAPKDGRPPLLRPSRGEITRGCVWLIEAGRAGERGPECRPVRWPYQRCCPPPLAASPPHAPFCASAARDHLCALDDG